MSRQARTVVLASTSPYRRELLARLELSFATAAPEVDESAHEQESPQDLVARLSQAKARACAAQFADALLIGSDQVAVIGGEILGKPGSRDRAREQLANASGRCVQFLTGLCLYDALNDTEQLHVEPFSVQFRHLSADQIDRYLDREQPYNCAGSFKSEGLGIALFEKMIGDDPSALMGLPLIRLTRMLENAGLAVL